MSLFHIKQVDPGKGFIEVGWNVVLFMSTCVSQSFLFAPLKLWKYNSSLSWLKPSSFSIKIDLNVNMWTWCFHFGLTLCSAQLFLNLFFVFWSVQLIIFEWIFAYSKTFFNLIYMLTLYWDFIRRHVTFIYFFNSFVPSSSLSMQVISSPIHVLLFVIL